MIWQAALGMHSNSFQLYVRAWCALPSQRLVCCFGCMGSAGTTHLQLTCSSRAIVLQAQQLHPLVYGMWQWGVRRLTQHYHV
jgi:hypothetical protein